MQPFATIRFRTLCRNCLLVFICTFLAGSLSAGALPEPGTPAPPLQFTQLLQAPPGARADWAALRGKVVVLEFWATWCGPCVASMPHLNQLVAELDPAKFQFISVDDEDLKVVQEFLTKRKMAGWAGIDTTKEIFKRFGVISRPATIIVNGQGRVVAVTTPESLTAVYLIAVADGKIAAAGGKSVKSVSMDDKPAAIVAKPPAMMTKAPETPVKPLYEVSLSKAPPDAQSWIYTGPGKHRILNGKSAGELLAIAYSVPKDRLFLTSPLPEGLYTLSAVWSSPEGNDDQHFASFIQAAIAYGLNLRIQPKTITRKAYVLKATEASKRLLIPQPAIRMSKRDYWAGHLMVINGSADDLATALEDGLEAPVVNETGIEGRFDAELEFPAKDADAAKAALLKTTGLELIQEDRPIQMIEVSSRDDAKKQGEAKPQAKP